MRTQNAPVHVGIYLFELIEMARVLERLPLVGERVFEFTLRYSIDQS